jgi:uncharacterized membrane protein YkvA (DUF1232 family)/DNA-binding Xre family transcriptional regulator
VARDPRFQLEETVKTLLRERSMSMRQLAESTGIHVATISRMVTGKQRVNPEYLYKIAGCLSVPPKMLFTAAGFEVDTGTMAWRKVSCPSGEIMQEILDHLDVRAQCLSKREIEQELVKYEIYAKTAEGQALIAEKFPDKRKQIVGIGPFVEDLDILYQRFSESDISAEERWVLGGGLLYFVSATDVIPDYLFPIGYLDDALAIQITRSRLLHGLLPRKQEVDVEGTRDLGSGVSS